MSRGVVRRGLEVTLLLLLLALLYRLLDGGGLIESLDDSERLRAVVSSAGPWGPLAVIAAIALAVVFNPLPSAPIALAAGALYGHGWGTLYVLTGAELGALTAFALARTLGREALSRRLREYRPLQRFTTQRSLMVMVFISRMLPFLSYDLISYAAGLTPLSPWRFALATLAGILPASFLLAHFGGTLAGGDRLESTLTTVLLLGLVPLIPLLIAFARRRRSARQPTLQPGNDR